MRACLTSLLAGLVLFVSGCATQASPSPVSCTPGAQQACTCSGGASGTETCGSSGVGYGACSCAADDGGTDPDGGSCGDGGCGWQGTNIRHVVLIVEENHTFDSYFGSYCTAPAYSNPTCTSGRGCCEAAPAQDPAGSGPFTLNDAANYYSDHDHGELCEVCEIDDGGMDRFTDGGCPTDFGSLTGFVTYDCSSPENFMVARDASLMSTYWSYADQYALADRYFQPIAGGTSSNDMYLAVAHYEFLDNDVLPPARGAGCTTDTSPQPGTALSGRTTIADLLLDQGYTFGVYADGFSDAYNAWPSCPPPGGTCRESFFTQACEYDPSDVPFQYYPQFTDNLSYIHDLTQFAGDVDGAKLPDFAYVKYRTSGNEHPAWSYVSDGEANVDAIVQAILSSPVYQANTLVLLVWDEGGGFFDHVPPPPSIENFPADAGALAGQPVPYGTRVPMLAIGAFAKQGSISHVTLEHSSIVRFLEWNFLGPQGEGALHESDPAARDDRVNNLGSLLDASKVGATVP